ncbi:MAG: hypothetical protein ACRDGL_11315 [Candidatus Limnocylindrales bacterium]
MSPQRSSGRLVIAAFIAGSLALACSAGARPDGAGLSAPAGAAATAEASSGIGVRLSGQVVAGPVCPVERDPPDPSCAPRPVPGARLVVKDARGAVVASLTADEHGAFATLLPRGDYTIGVEGLTGPIRAPIPTGVRLGAAGTTDLTIRLDTGIR